MFRSTRPITVTAGILAGLALSAATAHPQASASATTTVAGPGLNDIAPDFALAGATRFGVLKAPVRLSDFRGKTVVLAFFYQARTKG